jgi:outer membrane protein TolC
VKLRNQAISSMTKVSVSLVKIDATRIHVEATSLRAEAIRKGFLAGVKTRGDIARAESEYIQARQRRANEMLEYASAWAGLVVTTAQIDPIFLEGTPPAIKLPVRMVASP